MAVLVAGGLYGAVSADPAERTERWLGPVPWAVEGGRCTRDLRLLPSLEPRAPHFVIFAGDWYVRQEAVPEAPRLTDTGYSFRRWRLMRAGRNLYLRSKTDHRSLFRFSLGRCPTRDPDGGMSDVGAFN